MGNSPRRVMNPDVRDLKSSVRTLSCHLCCWDEEFGMAGFDAASVAAVLVGATQLAMEVPFPSSPLRSAIIDPNPPVSNRT